MLAEVQPLLSNLQAHLDEDVSLAALAAEAGVSRFHFHRRFARVVGETAKQYTLRLRLERAAAALVAGRDSILEVALDCGFQSHEAFSRAFRRRFQMAPRAYRARGLAGVSEPEVRAHATLVKNVGPCIGLYRQPGRTEMTYSISKKELSPQHVLYTRRRVKPSEIAVALGEILPAVFGHAQGAGLPLAGPPFTRYVEMGPGLLTMEAGLPLAAPAASAGAIEAGTLPGGWVASTVHAGAYDGLRDAYAAIEAWMGTQGLAPAGAPWESYVTDPGEYPDPKDWKTEVYWPVKAA